MLTEFSPRARQTVPAFSLRDAGGARWGIAADGAANHLLPALREQLVEHSPLRCSRHNTQISHANEAMLADKGQRRIATLLL
jgi:hypothetical protein